MVVVGCAGFPVPPTKYFKEFAFAEVADCTPGSGTVRRWRREAPKTFGFAVFAPKEMVGDAFKESDRQREGFDALAQLTKELDARIAVVGVPDDVPANRNTKSALKDLLVRAREACPRVVVWANHWGDDDVLKVASDADVHAALDPLKSGVAKGKFAYYRLPGPAGYKSRYEDPVIDELGAIVGTMKHEEAYVVFANVDMAQDAKRLSKQI